ncbi:ABC-type transport auxiliary lipoprotein family protein [Sulfitobacter sp.]|uniref:ABC-type transport auxiliary lipoprotein family protein n=1 Tax=Sulfitobacter sp. TaxID=1903071 RepID=UPI00329925EA
MTQLTRRAAVLSAICSLGGCSAISSLNAASEPLDTYDLRPVAGPKSGRRTTRTLLVAKPQASAPLTSDRILVKPDAVSITYLPEARWSDELPDLVQSVLVQSISGTGRLGYVGRSDAGPIPDKAMLVRIDAFEVAALQDSMFEARVVMDMTIINDSDQRVVGSRQFSQTRAVSSDTPQQIVIVFQEILNDLLPDISDWSIRLV